LGGIGDFALAETRETRARAWSAADRYRRRQLSVGQF
jgi:hypothetical protein